MTLEVPPAELYGLADVLRAQALAAQEVGAALVDGPVGGPLQGPVEELLATSRAATAALSGQLRWLGDTVAGVADSWLGLDGSVLAPRGTAVPQ